MTMSAHTAALAGLDRKGAIAAGHDPADEPYLQLRDTRTLKKHSPERDGDR